MSKHTPSTTKKKNSVSRKATPAKKTIRRGLTSDPERPKLAALSKRPAANRRASALRRLGVSAAQLSEAATFTDILKVGKGGLKTALDAMRYSTDINVVRFLEEYDKVPLRDRASLPWEAIALAAELSVTHLLGGIVLALRDQSVNMVKVLALTHHPEITRKTIEFAALPGGEKDRHTLHQSLGLLPTPKGSTFIVNPGARPVGQAGPEPDEDIADAEPIEAGEDREGDLNLLFPSLTETQEALIPPKARLLEGAK